MASKSRENETQAATGDYSATKAPENRPHVESKVHSIDDSLKPGGSHGAPVDVGMSELYRENVPSEARVVNDAMRESPDRPDRPGQPGDLETRDRRGKVSPRRPDQAEGERGDGA